MSRKKWLVSSCDKDTAAEFAEKYGLFPFAALLAYARGITEGERCNAFFNGGGEPETPFALKDMDKAAARISKAVEEFERIAVYGDYDADGITATAILFSYLEALGADVVYYIPERSEGYGLNEAAIKSLSERGVRLIVTVDCGVSAVENAEYISSLGMELVVTDHHLPGDKLPTACAVVDPHRADCPSRFKELAGAGVAFKLVCALNGGEIEDMLDEYCDLLAIGTVGDVMPLVGENRTVVRRGVSMINAGTRIGINALREVSGTLNKSLSSTGIAFTIVPRLNAAGRMGSPERALRLLLEDDEALCRDIAGEINEANAERHREELGILNDIISRIESEPKLRYSKIIVVDGEGWNAGVVGIVAARLVDIYGRPAVVIARDGDSARGSGRSLEGFSLFEAIKHAQSVLTHFGGHTLAAGIGLESEKIGEFRRLVNEYAENIEMPFPVLKLDCKLKCSFIDNDLLDALASLEPYGSGNPQPLFGLYKMTVAQISPVSDGKHLRLTFTKDRNKLTAMLFGCTEKDFSFGIGETVDLAVTVDRNDYNGAVRPSVHIKDIKPSATDDDAVLGGIRLFEKIKRGEALTRDEALAAKPDRVLVAKLFRLLSANPEMQTDPEKLCLRLGDSGAGICKVCVALETLVSLGIIRIDGGTISVPPSSEKHDLEKSELFKYLNMYI